MNVRIISLVLCAFLILAQACRSQSKTKPNAPPFTNVGGGCDGCEAIYDGMPNPELLTNVDTLPDYQLSGPKMLVYGTIYEKDGKTPAPNVIFYIYHTDQTGHYTASPGQIGAGRRHGAIRGWIKTNSSGTYYFYTLKPAPYPNASIPAHIHPIIKETGMNEYYIDEFLFAGDPFLKNANKGAEDRGGNGIVTLAQKGDLFMCKRDIILGLNIPNYPK